MSTGTDVIVQLNGTDVVEVTVERVDGLFMLVKELLDDFRQEIVDAKAYMDTKAAEADASAQYAASKAAQLEGWFNTVGFPFWKGTQAQYDAITTKNPDVLYLITG